MLFLTLNTFSATGGIEKVCRAAGRAFEQICNEKGRNFFLFSMHDGVENDPTPYISDTNYTPFAGRKISFVIHAVLKAKKSRVVVLSHVNLALAGWLIKMFSPKARVVLIAHGIEVWDRPLSFVQRRFLKKADMIAAVSHYTMNRLTSNLKLNNVRVINDCLDPFLKEPSISRQEIRKRHGFSETDFILLTVTRLAYTEVNKNYDHILVSLGELRGKTPPVKYLFIGKYDLREKDRLIEKAAGLGVADRLVFTGFVSDEELPSYYKACDLYVMPSKKEGFGLTFVEAAYYGLPVIAGNQDGTTDALLDGRLGLLINPDSQSELDGAIEKVYANPIAFRPDTRLVDEHFGFGTYKNNWKKVL